MWDFCFANGLILIQSDYHFAAYKQLFEEGLVKVWDTKVYFNAVEHYMDDTTRPENLVHMDMPGWSTTYGLLSKINLQKDRYSSKYR
jgi:iron complex outermembrane receptor protein